MHDKFADWYRIVTSGTDGALQPEALERLWAGVETAVGQTVNGQELDLVRLLLQKETGQSDVEASFRAAIKKADPTFSMHGNDLEVSILAGAALILLMNGEDKAAADRVALALLCSEGVPTSASRPWVTLFLGEADAYYHDRIGNLRRPRERSPLQFNADAINSAAKAFEQALPTQDWSNRVPNTMKTAFAAVAKKLEELALSTAQGLDHLAREQAHRKEESDILWWMTAEYSRDLDCPISEVKTPGTCLVVGKELADLVSAPGPMAARSVLHRVLRAAGEEYENPVQLKAAVSATPPEWRTALTQQPGVERVRDLCPVLGAVAASLSTERETEWLPAYKKAYKVDPKQKLDALDLAVQTYRECLLAQAVGEL